MAADNIVAVAERREQPGSVVFAPALVVIGKREYFDIRAFPLFVEFFGSGSKASLIAAGITDQHDVLEAMNFQASRRRFKQPVEHRRWVRKLSRILTVGTALGNVLNCGSDKRGSELAGNQFGAMSNNEIVLSKKH